jgi:hypothetical protein
MKLSKIAKRFRIDKPAKFRLSDHDPADCCGLSIDKDDAKAMLKEGVARLSDLQESFTPTISGRYWWSFRRWMPPARTASSSTS